MEQGLTCFMGMFHTKGAGKKGQLDTASIAATHLDGCRKCTSGGSSRTRRGRTASFGVELTGAFKFIDKLSLPGRCSRNRRGKKADVDRA